MFIKVYNITANFLFTPLHDQKMPHTDYFYKIHIILFYMLNTSVFHPPDSEFPNICDVIGPQNRPIWSLEICKPQHNVLTHARLVSQILIKILLSRDSCSGEMYMITVTRTREMSIIFLIVTRSGPFAKWFRIIF